MASRFAEQLQGAVLDQDPRAMLGPSVTPSQQTQGGIMVDTPWGPQSFPDGTPEQDMKAALDGQAYQQQLQQAPPIARAMHGVFGSIPGMQDERPYTMPKFANADVFGLSSENMGRVMGTVQGNQQQNAAEKIRQRVQREREVEQIKDQEQQLKLEQTRFQYQQKVEAFRQKQAEARAKMQAEADVAKEEAKQKGLTEREAMKPISIPSGGRVIFPETGESFENPRTFAPQRPNYEQVDVQLPDGTWGKQFVVPSPGESYPVPPKAASNKPKTVDDVFTYIALTRPDLVVRDDYGDVTSLTEEGVVLLNQMIAGESPQSPGARPQVDFVYKDGKLVPPGDIANGLSILRDAPDSQFQPAR